MFADHKVTRFGWSTIAMIMLSCWHSIMEMLGAFLCHHCDIFLLNCVGLAAIYFVLCTFGGEPSMLCFHGSCRTGLV